ncbi:hypothetical protein [Micromonospora profundi]|uniref:hypothetical protein n=1 Tax=Micromonospora profundi TaxID=1420889 RepID=UPI0036B92497
MSRRRREARDSRDRVAELEQLYAELPQIQCKDFCVESCGPIAMSPLERQRIKERGVEITTLAPTCPALTQIGLCSVYEVRPMICRLWGLVEQMACLWGCRPEGGFLDDLTARRLLRRADVIGAQTNPARPAVTGIGDDGPARR